MKWNTYHNLIIHLPKATAEQQATSCYNLPIMNVKTKMSVLEKHIYWIAGFEILTEVTSTF
jgi:hypothetical protein